jgi:hypothetical protein
VCGYSLFTPYVFGSWAYFKRLNPLYASTKG